MSDEQQSTYTPDLMRLARQARTRPGFLAEPLFAYQDAHTLTDEQLAAEVGVSVEQLKHLALCQVPASDEDIATIADHVQADARLLSDWIERQPLDPISRVTQPDGRVLYRLWSEEARQAILLEPHQLLDLMVYASDNEELIRRDSRANDPWHYNERKTP
jgi:hypothetical protein